MLQLIKTITPSPVLNENATHLVVAVTHMTANTSAAVTYSACRLKPGTTNELLPLANGALTMDGQAYQDWTDDDNFVAEWVAESKGLVITGDYVPA